MNTFKRLLGLGLVVALVLPIRPAYASEQRSANFMAGYDLDSTSLTFCRVTGADGSPFGAGIHNGDRISTSGSSTTTSEVSDTDPFDLLAVNDIIEVHLGNGAPLTRVIAVRTSASAVVVDSAWDLTSTPGFVFRWWDTACGTAATDGWIDVAGWDKFTITFLLEQVNATGGIDVQVQCRLPGLIQAPVQVFPSCTTGACNTYQNYTTAGIASATTIVADEPWSECRVGVKINSADDGGDLTTNAERITSTLLLEKATR